MTNLVFLGPPGAGKGTLSQELCKQEKLMHISTGDLLRAEIKQGSDLGNEVKAIVQAGNLVPDELVSNLLVSHVAKEIETGKFPGCVFDGYPRTVNQADLLGTALVELDIPLDGVVLLEVMEEVLVLRLTGRRICRACNAIFHMAFGPSKVDGICDECGGELYQRPDDNEESVMERLKVYEKETKPLVEYYESQGLLLRVDASRDKATNIASMRKILSPILRATSI